MKNINNSKIQHAIKISNGEEEIILIENETNIIIETDKTDFEKNYRGKVTFISKDAIEVDNGKLIYFEYIEKIDIIETK